jgi:hypothetical protein
MIKYYLPCKSEGIANDEIECVLTMGIPRDSSFFTGIVGECTSNKGLLCCLL